MFKREFAHPAQEEGAACVPFLGGNLDAVLGAPYARTVGQDQGVHFERGVLPIGTATPT